MAEWTSGKFWCICYLDYNPIYLEKFSPPSYNVSFIHKLYIFSWCQNCFNNIEGSPIGFTHKFSGHSPLNWEFEFPNLLYYFTSLFSGIEVTRQPHYIHYFQKCPKVSCMQSPRSSFFFIISLLGFPKVNVLFISIITSPEVK